VEGASTGSHPEGNKVTEAGANMEKEFETPFAQPQQPETRNPLLSK
jgi:hypothetical protein